VRPAAPRPFFVACFSQAYAARTRTLNEELLLAIAEVRLRPEEASWFVPIRLDECESRTGSVKADRIFLRSAEVNFPRWRPWR
jgi:hypothetical protein